jgi:hypothetical protein
MSEIQDLAEELVENGMPEIARELRRHGPDAALTMVDNEIARLRNYPDGD